MQTRFSLLSCLFPLVCCFALLGVSFVHSQTAIEPLDKLPPGLGGTDYLVDLSLVPDVAEEQKPHAGGTPCCRLGCRSSGNRIATRRLSGFVLF